MTMTTSGVGAAPEVETKYGQKSIMGSFCRHRRKHVGNKAESFALEHWTLNEK